MNWMWTNLNQNWSTSAKTDQHGYVTIVGWPITGFARTMLHQNAGLTTERAHMEMDLHQNTFYDVRIPDGFRTDPPSVIKVETVILKKRRIRGYVNAP